MAFRKTMLITISEQRPAIFDDSSRFYVDKRELNQAFMPID